MDDGAAGEVERAETPDETSAGRKCFSVGGIGGHDRAAPPPDHVRHRIVDDHGPENGEDHNGAELHALSNAAKHERCGDARERHLERDEGEFGNGDADGEGFDERRCIDADEERFA